MLDRGGGGLDPGVIKPLLARLAGRGPEAIIAVDRLVAAGPVTVTGGGLTVVGDMRLDNRGELARRLSLPANVPDAELVLASYRKWGPDAVGHLVGDFAWVLWDDRRGELVCARDPMGVKPFYYHLGPRTFAFSSQIAPLLVLHEVSRRINETAVADRLVGFVEDTSSTLFRDVARLPPGRVLVVSRDRTELRVPWALDPDRELEPATDREYEERFLAAFTEAVRTRLAGGRPVAAALSGGLDSSSITCVAHALLSAEGRGPLPVFTGVFDTSPKSDERTYADAVVRHTGATSHWAHPEHGSPLADWEGAPWRSAELVSNPQIMVSKEVLGAARDRGVGVMLDGLGGDFVVSYGVDRIPELARAGRIGRSLHETAAFAHRVELPLARAVTRFLVRPLLPRPVDRLWQWGRARRLGEEAWPLPTPIRRETSRRLGLKARIAEMGGEHMRPPRTQRHGQWLELTSGLVPMVLEGADRTAAIFGVEPRYPFFDRRLVELCLALPPDQKLRAGWTRSILRRSLQGTVPEAVCWRRNKGNLGFAFRLGLATADKPVLDKLVADPGPVAEWVDSRLLTDLYNRCHANGRSDDWFTLWRVAVMGLWLKHHA